jgi:hypothetical protein
MGALFIGVVHLLLGAGLVACGERPGPVSGLEDHTPDAGAPDARDSDSSGDDPALRCPAPGSLPYARTFEDYVIDGEQLFVGAATWSWTVTGGPCDQLFVSEGKPTTFELRGGDTPRLTFRPSQVGDYLVRASIATSTGDSLSCSFPLRVVGTGLHVELCWDTTGMDDLDLHVHAPSSTANWFTEDDCYYMNCSGSSPRHIDWGYVKSPLSGCDRGPDGSAWTTLGGCINPRLDFDNVAIAGVVEAIDLDAPVDGATYRTMASYLGSYQDGIPVTHPIANVYCQGRLVASFGQLPDLVQGFDQPDIGATGSMWRVADITTHVDGAGVTTCDVVAIHPAGMTTGYDVRVGEASY